MDDEVTLTGEEAVLASRITTIDRDLGALDERVRQSVVLGLHGWGAALSTNLAQTRMDEQRAALMQERADLVGRLQRAIAEN